MFTSKIKKNKDKKGFTLVETLIAISILMISVAAPLSLAAKGIEATTLAKQQIVAYYLAQDAYEFVKNKVDSNKLTGNIAGEGIIAGLSLCDGGNKCKIDTIDTEITPYTLDDKLNHSDILHVYTYNNIDPESIYHRYVEIEDKYYDNGTISEIKVKVVVKWTVPFIGDQTYILEGHITNW